MSDDLKALEATSAIIEPGVYDPAALLASLRRREDQLFWNYADPPELVWLKPHVVGGKRIGITDCCLAEDPCDHHARLTHPAPGVVN